MWTRKAKVYKYGEFFPAELSPHGYNETLAQGIFFLFLVMRLWRRVLNG